MFATISGGEKRYACALAKLAFPEKKRSHGHLLPAPLSLSRGQLHSCRAMLKKESVQDSL